MRKRSGKARGRLVVAVATASASGDGAVGGRTEAGTMTTSAPERPSTPKRAGSSGQNRVRGRVVATIVTIIAVLCVVAGLAVVFGPQRTALDRAAETVVPGSSDQGVLQATLVVRDLVEAIEQGDTRGIRAAFTDTGKWGVYRVDDSDGRGGVEAALADFREVPRRLLSGPVAGLESEDRTVSVSVDWLLEQNGRSVVEPSRYLVQRTGGAWHVTLADGWWAEVPEAGASAPSTFTPGKDSICTWFTPGGMTAIVAQARRDSGAQVDAFDAFDADGCRSYVDGLLGEWWSTPSWSQEQGAIRISLYPVTRQELGVTSPAMSAAFDAPFVADSRLGPAAARSATFPELGFSTGVSLLLRVSGSDEVFFFGLAVPGQEDAPVTNAPVASPYEDLAIGVAARMLRQMGWAP